MVSFMSDATIGDRIRDARLARGLTQVALAPLVGVTQGAISSWEQGTETPSFVHMLKLLLHLPELRKDLPREQIDLLVHVERALFADRCTCQDCSCHTPELTVPAARRR